MVEGIIHHSHIELLLTLNLSRIRLLDASKLLSLDSRGWNQLTVESCKRIKEKTKQLEFFQRIAQQEDAISYHKANSIWILVGWMDSSR